jgi:hypothetical protein
MKSKAYKKNFLIIAFLIVICHIAILSSGIFHVPLTKLFLMDGLLFLLFLASTLIIAPGLDKASDNFVNRFLLLTTLQLLTMMVTILSLSLIKMNHFKAIGYHLLSVFIALLSAQAILLVRKIKKS